MATAPAPAPTPPPAKSPLHNFPPTFFKWSSKPPHHRRCRRRSPPPETDTKAPAPAEQQLEPPESEKPWNLRPRSKVVTPAAESAATENSNLPKSTTAMRLRGFDSQAERGGNGGERKEKRKFWIALSKEEIEEDIYSLTGSRPSRRPKRRPKNVQKQLDSVFPGLWLVGLSAETYRTLDANQK